MILRYTILLLILILVQKYSYAQIDLGMPAIAGKGGAASSYVNDYNALGINPSNLGWGWNENHFVAISLANFDFKAQSKAFERQKLRQAFTNTKEEFTETQKAYFSEVFTTKDGLNMQMNITWFAASAQIPKIGGIALNLRDRATGHISANNAFADIAFKGSNSDIFADTAFLNKNMSELFNGTALNYLHYREFNIGYGRKILTIGNKDGNHFSIYGGIGFKYLWGMSIIDIEMYQDNFLARTSIEKSSFDVNNGAISNFTIKGAPSIFNSAGSGHAFDFGASIIFNKRIKFAASFVDMGSITWNKNILEAQDQPLMPLDSTQTGLNSFEIRQQADYLFDTEGLLNFEAGNSFKTTFPSKVRLGAGIKFSQNIETGADLVIPANNMNGNLDNAYLAIGGEIKIFDDFIINTGVSGNSNYGYSIPVGIKLPKFGIFEIYLATNDILTYFNSNKNPFISFTFGLIKITL